MMIDDDDGYWCGSYCDCVIISISGSRQFAVDVEWWSNCFSSSPKIQKFAMALPELCCWRWWWLLHNGCSVWLRCREWFQFYSCSFILSLSQNHEIRHDLVLFVALIMMMVEMAVVFVYHVRSGFIVILLIFSLWFCELWRWPWDYLWGAGGEFWQRFQEARCRSSWVDWQQWRFRGCWWWQHVENEEGIVVR